MINPFLFHIAFLMFVTKLDKYHLSGKNIIDLLPKSGSKGPRDQMSFRGITLAATMYKIYASILNDRIVKWTDDSDLIVEEQNGFHKKHTTVDHLSSLQFKQSLESTVRCES